MHHGWADKDGNQQQDPPDEGDDEEQKTNKANSSDGEQVVWANLQGVNINTVSVRRGEVKTYSWIIWIEVATVPGR